MERPRQRIVACAQDLFHRHGIRGVGVETIAEAAGTNKMTLYRHFGSKDDLIIEYLNYKGKKADEVWAEVEAASPGDPIGQLYVFVEKAARFIAEDERGCDLANAAVELTQDGHPGLRVIEEFKIRQRDRLAETLSAPRARQSRICWPTPSFFSWRARGSAAAASGPRVRARTSFRPAKRSLHLLASSEPSRLRRRAASRPPARPGVTETARGERAEVASIVPMADLAFPAILYYRL